MLSLVRSCCATALATAVAITATVISPSGQGLAQQTVKAGYQSVSIPMVALAAFGTGLATPPPTASVAPTGVAPSANTTAAEITPQNFLPLVVGVGIGVVAAAFWYPTFLVTFPLSYFGINALFSIFRIPPLDLGTTAQLFLALPFSFGASLVGNPQIFSPTAAAVPATASLRSAASRPTSQRNEIAMRDNSIRRASVDPAAATSKRSAKSAAASNKPAAASAASKRRSAN